MPRATGGHMGMRSLAVAVGGALGLLACAPHEQGAPDTMATRELSAHGWIDVTATLDPARTPVYAGDAPLKFDFLKDMRKGDKRSEEHTSELQSLRHLVCRLLLEKKNRYRDLIIEALQEAALIIPNGQIQSKD